jgi:hypothetical protein
MILFINNVVKWAPVLNYVVFLIVDAITYVRRLMAGFHVYVIRVKFVLHPW